MRPLRPLRPEGGADRLPGVDVLLLRGAQDLHRRARRRGRLRPGGTPHPERPPAHAHGRVADLGRHRGGIHAGHGGGHGAQADGALKSRTVKVRKTLLRIQRTVTRECCTRTFSEEFAANLCMTRCSAHRIARNCPALIRAISAWMMKSNLPGICKTGRSFCNVVAVCVGFFCFCRVNLHFSQNRCGGGKFQFGHRRAHNGCAGDGLGHGFPDTYAGRFGQH